MRTFFQMVFRFISGILMLCLLAARELQAEIPGQNLGLNGDGQGLSFALNSEDGPAFSFFRTDTFELVFEEFKGGDWLRESVDSSLSELAYVRVDDHLEIPSSSTLVFLEGEPHIAYYNRATSKLMHAYRQNATWSKEEIVNGLSEGGAPSMTVCQTELCLSFYNGVSRTLEFARGNTGSWSSHTVDAASQVGAMSDIAVNQFGRPVILYFDALQKRPKLAVQDQTNAWIFNTLEYFGHAFGLYPSIVLDASDNMHISLSRYQTSASTFDRSVYYGYKLGNAPWEILELARDYSGGPSSIVLDQNGRPQLVHRYLRRSAVHGDASGVWLYSLSDTGLWERSFLTGELGAADAIYDFGEIDLKQSSAGETKVAYNFFQQEHLEEPELQAYRLHGDNLPPAQSSSSGDSSSSSESSPQSSDSSSGDSSSSSGGLGGECEDWQSRHPDWIWCDSFEDEVAVAEKYFDFSDAEGRFVRQGVESVDGDYAMRARWEQGNASAGWLMRNFGGNPAGSQSHQSENFGEIYWRAYFKLEPDFLGVPDKFFRAMIFGGADWSQAMIAHVWRENSGNRLLMDPVSGIDQNDQLATTGWNDFDNFRWLGARAGQTEIVAGQWHCVEAHVKLNTPGEQNGVFEFWVDRQLEASRSDIDWLGAWTDFGINSVLISNYINGGAAATQERYIDAFVVSRAPIGCIDESPSSSSSSSDQSSSSSSSDTSTSSSSESSSESSSTSSSQSSETSSSTSSSATSSSSSETSSPSSSSSSSSGEEPNFTVRINSGGEDYIDSSGRAWMADADFVSGTPILETADIAETEDDLIYQSARQAKSFSYEIPLDSGLYQVTLHFADIDTPNAARRKIGVFLEDQLVIDGLNVFNEVGVLTPMARRYQVYVDDGSLSINLLGQRRKAFISGIEIIQHIPPTVLINAGGGPHVDGLGHEWQEDSYFRGGFIYQSSDDIAGTNDDLIFQTERYGNRFTYEVPVSGGTYDVILHFAEIYFDESQIRNFDVKAEGQLVVEGLDIWAQVGKNAPFVQAFTITVTDGILDIEFSTQTSTAKVSAIEVWPSTP